MKRIVQRYLAANFIPPFLLSVFFFVSFLLTFQLFRIIKLVINKGISPEIVLSLVGNIAVAFLPMAIPLSTLFATIYTMNKLSEDSEIVAMRSFGVSKFELFKPFLILGVLIALSIFALNQNIIPKAQKEFKNGVIRLTSRGLVTDIKGGHFFVDIPQVTLFAEKVESGGKRLEDVFIHMKSKDGKEEKVILAESGALIKQGQDKWGAGALRMQLSKGNITKSVIGSGNVEKILFDHYDFPIVSGDYQPDLVTKDSMRTSSELWKIMNLPEKQRHKIVDDTNYIKTQLEFWSRLNTPLQCLVFIFIGFSLGIKQGRGRGKNTGALGLITLILYYALFFTGVSLSRKGTIPAVVSVFLPTIIAAFFARLWYRKLDWLS